MTPKELEKFLELKHHLKIHKKELKRYIKAYNEVMCYFDSISDEEQEALDKRLTKIFNN